MTGLRRFHPAYSVQLMRRWLAVCLLPLLNALRAFDLAAFRAALWQEGALLLALAAAAVLLWLPAGWKLEQGSLVICRGLAAEFDTVCEMAGGLPRMWKGALSRE